MNRIKSASSVSTKGPKGSGSGRAAAGVTGFHWHLPSTLGTGTVCTWVDCRGLWMPPKATGSELVGPQVRQPAGEGGRPVAVGHPREPLPHMSQRLATTRAQPLRQLSPCPSVCRRCGGSVQDGIGTPQDPTRDPSAPLAPPAVARSPALQEHRRSPRPTALLTFVPLAALFKGPRLAGQEGDFPAGLSAPEGTPARLPSKRHPQSGQQAELCVPGVRAGLGGLALAGG